MKNAGMTLLVALAMLSAFPSTSVAIMGEEALMDDAANVLVQTMSIPEAAVPSAILANAGAIAVIPAVFTVKPAEGEQLGRGVLSIRRKDGRWSNPVFVTLMSGSAGWRVEAGSANFVIFFMNMRSVEGILKGKYVLGTDVPVTAGPFRRSAKASSDAERKAEIYSYSRNRGEANAVSLEGSSMEVDRDNTEVFWSKPNMHLPDILEGKGVRMRSAAKRLMDELERHTR